MNQQVEKDLVNMLNTINTNFTNIRSKLITDLDVGEYYVKLIKTVNTTYGDTCVLLLSNACDPGLDWVDVYMGLAIPLGELCYKPNFIHMTNEGIKQDPITGEQYPGLSFGAFQDTKFPEDIIMKDILNSFYSK